MRECGLGQGKYPGPFGISEFLGSVTVSGRRDLSLRPRRVLPGDKRASRSQTSYIPLQGSHGPLADMAIRRLTLVVTRQLSRCSLRRQSGAARVISRDEKLFLPGAWSRCQRDHRSGRLVHPWAGSQPGWRAGRAYGGQGRQAAWSGGSGALFRRTVAGFAVLRGVGPDCNQIVVVALLLVLAWLGA